MPFDPMAHGHLMRDVTRRLRNPFRFLSNRHLADRIDRLLANQALAPDRPSMVTSARMIWAHVQGASIEPDEQDVRGHAEGIEVRGWLLVPTEYLEKPDPGSLERMKTALLQLPPKTIEIFLLSRVEGLDLPEIAVRLHMPIWRVRRHLRHALRHAAHSLDA